MFSKITPLTPPLPDNECSSFIKPVKFEFLYISIINVVSSVGNFPEEEGVGLNWCTLNFIISLDHYASRNNRRSLMIYNLPYGFITFCIDFILQPFYLHIFHIGFIVRLYICIFLICLMY